MEDSKDYKLFSKFLVKNYVCSSCMRDWLTKKKCNFGDKPCDRIQALYLKAQEIK